MLSFWVGTVPLPSESPLGTTPGPEPGQGGRWRPWEGAQGAVPVPSLGGLRPLAGQGSVQAGAVPTSADWARAGPAIWEQVLVSLGICCSLAAGVISWCWGWTLARPKAPFLLEIWSHRAACHVFCGQRSFVSK